jgi:hypothetical protein
MAELRGTSSSVEVEGTGSLSERVEGERTSLGCNGRDGRSKGYVFFYDLFIHFPCFLHIKKNIQTQLTNSISNELKKTQNEITNEKM